MSPSNQTLKRPNLVTGNWLSGIGESPLSRPPSYSGGNSESNPESSSDGCAAGYSERNPESCTDRCSVSYSTSCLEENSASSLEGCGDRCSAGCSAECPENRSAGSPENNLPSNGANNLLSCSESTPADSRASSPVRRDRNPNRLSAIRLCLPLPILFSDARPLGHDRLRH